MPSEIPGGYLAYSISHVLHDWDDADVVRILTSVRSAMEQTVKEKPDSKPKLLLLELFLHANSSRYIKASSMQLLALSNGITRTYDEMKVLVQKAGMKVSNIVEMRALASVLEVQLA